MFLKSVKVRQWNCFSQCYEGEFVIDLEEPIFEVCNSLLLVKFPALLLYRVVGISRQIQKSTKCQFSLTMNRKWPNLSRILSKTIFNFKGIPNY